MKSHFIIIDDSQLDCFIAEKLIRHISKSATVKNFTEAEIALEYIKSYSVPYKGTLTILLLDILMPIMDGFEFLELFEKLPEAVQSNYYIVAITSSRNKRDISKIRNYKSVQDLLDKPITGEALSLLLNQVDSKLKGS